MVKQQIKQLNFKKIKSAKVVADYFDLIGINEDDILSCLKNVEILKKENADLKEQIKKLNEKININEDKLKRLVATYVTTEQNIYDNVKPTKEIIKKSYSQKVEEFNPHAKL